MPRNPFRSALDDQQYSIAFTRSYCPMSFSPTVSIQPSFPLDTTSTQLLEADNSVISPSSLIPLKRSLISPLESPLASVRNSEPFGQEHLDIQKDVSSPRASVESQVDATSKRRLLRVSEQRYSTNIDTRLSNLWTNYMWSKKGWFFANITSLSSWQRNKYDFYAGSLIPLSTAVIMAPLFARLFLHLSIPNWAILAFMAAGFAATALLLLYFNVSQGIVNFWFDRIDLPAYRSIELEERIASKA
jgi:hypothetical protein